MYQCINIYKRSGIYFLTINLLSLCVVSVRTTRVTTIRGVLLTCNLHCDYMAICSQHHERRYCESFFIVTILLTVFKQCFTPHFFKIDGLIKKIQKNTLGFSILKMSRRTPAPPHPRIIVLTPFNHDPQKIGEKTPSQLSFTSILTQCTVVQRTPIIDHSSIFDTPCIEKNHTF